MGEKNVGLNVSRLHWCANIKKYNTCNRVSPWFDISVAILCESQCNISTKYWDVEFVTPKIYRAQITV